MSKTSIPDAVKQLLFGMAAGRCEYRGCNKLLSRDAMGRRGRFSVFAHIVADAPDGPRGDPELSPRLAQDITNLMLLCFDDHRKIDVEDVAGHPVDLLNEMKARHEDRIRRLTELDDNHRTVLVLMAANIGDHKGLVDAQEARAVVLPRYAADDEVTIDLAHLRIVDGERVAWDVGMREIEEAARRLQERLVREGVQHLSIFALAPIPLLMYLGCKVGDVTPGETYQRLRTPAGWRWLPPDGNEPTLSLEVFEEAQPSQDICLVLSVSDEIDPTWVKNVAPKGTRYEIRFPDPKPDLVRTRAQLDDFRASVRSLLLRVRRTHGANVTLHVFPALPNSLAVEFGRVLLPKADPHMKIYDFNRASGGWSFALTLLPPIDMRSTDIVSDDSAVPAQSEGESDDL